MRYEVVSKVDDNDPPGTLDEWKRLIKKHKWVWGGVGEGDENLSEVNVVLNL